MKSTYVFLGWTDLKNTNSLRPFVPRPYLRFQFGGGIQFAVMMLCAMTVAACGADSVPPADLISTDIILGYLPDLPDHPNMHWLDDRQVAVVANSGEHCKRRDGSAEFLYRLAIFEIETKTKRWYGPLGVLGFCYANGQVSYPVLKNENGLCPEREVDLRIGPMGDEVSVIRESLRGIGVDPYTCKPRDPLPEWARALPRANIKRLRPEHGFLEIDRKSTLRWPSAVRLHKPGADRAHATDLSEILGSESRNDDLSIYPKFYQYKNAYLLDLIAKRVSSWWLHPDGHLEVAWSVANGNLKLPKTQFVSIVPTRGGNVASAMTLREDAIGHAGLHRIDKESRPHRLVAGRVSHALALSPNGCKLAFGNDTRQPDPRIPAKFFLQILDVCKEQAQ